MSIEAATHDTKARMMQPLLALRDEAKLQFHLLSLDAQRTFGELEDKVVALEVRANREGEHVTEVVKEAAHELTRALNQFMTTRVNASVGLLTSVRSLMTAAVRTCRVEDCLADAARVLWDDDCGALPVLSNDRVVGMLTDRDVCMATYTQGKSPAELRVEAAMSRQLFSCAPDESVGSALGIMSDKRVRRLPVIDAEGELVGVLSLADVARWARSLTNPAIDSALTETLAAICARRPKTAVAAAE